MKNLIGLVSILAVIFLSGCTAQPAPVTLEQTADSLAMGGFHITFSNITVLGAQDAAPIAGLTEGGKRVVFDDGSALIYYVYLTPWTDEELGGYAGYFIGLNNNKSTGTKIPGGTIDGYGPAQKTTFRGYPALSSDLHLTLDSGKELTVPTYFMYCGRVLVEITDLNGSFGAPSCG